MASHPYISGAGNVSQMVSHLRKAFPATITSDTVKRLGLAPNNESYVINVLQFIGVIDKDGKKTSEAAKVFTHHKDEEFAKSFEPLVKKSYSALFDLHGDQSWELGMDDLITFFRQTDQTSATIGRRQAGTFRILAGLSGHGEIPTPRNPNAQNKGSSKKKTSKVKVKPKKDDPKKVPPGRTGDNNREVGLTVRVEINLPADGTKEIYDNIFKSIKENLIDA